MRLIDADVLKDKLNDYIAIGDKRFVEGVLYYRGVVIDTINGSPVIAPYKHSYWTDKKTTFHDGELL